MLNTARVPRYSTPGLSRQPMVEAERSGLKENGVIQPSGDKRKRIAPAEFGEGKRSQTQSSTELLT